ncbi:MAG: YezD family protein [Dehalococcoidia bacterium]
MLKMLWLNSSPFGRIAEMPARPDSSRDTDEALAKEVLRAVRSVRHGYVQVIVQDSRVVQIDTLERRRLDRE